MKNIEIIEYPYFLHDNINYHFVINNKTIILDNEDIYETKEELLKDLGEKHNI